MNDSTLTTLTHRLDRLERASLTDRGRERWVQIGSRLRSRSRWR